ncbi:MAG: fluoride efflux transporter CrcB, partial [Kiritimatiellae bacterium]|nr:fluoride efflux transporter CrcB [Kiritimatiellia bacterium]
MKVMLAIGLAGAVGALLRYGCVRGVALLGCAFPWGTLLVNCVGAFLAGLCFILAKDRWDPFWVTVCFVGFLGAFTTFSTFALESVRLGMEGQIVKAMGNVLLQNVSGLLAVWLGMLAAKGLIEL